HRPDFALTQEPTSSMLSERNFAKVTARCAWSPALCSASRPDVDADPDGHSTLGAGLRCSVHAAPSSWRSAHPVVQAQPQTAATRSTTTLIASSTRPALTLRVSPTAPSTARGTSAARAWLLAFEK